MMAPQKRPAEETESLLVGVRSLLLDIEGTTTPITFVESTLYPYVKNNIESYLNKNFENADVQKAISALRDQAAKDKDEKVEGVIEIPGGDASKEDVVKAVSENVKWQMEEDKKTTELKALQGMVLKEAYESAEIKGELFEDVGPMLKMLAEEGFKLYVYSSGSIEAQKLLFKYSGQGDLSDVFSGFFDTTTGSKTDKASYKKIATEIGNEPKDILFLTDKPPEAEAAVSAGLRSALVIRPDNEELTDYHLQNFACIERFDELYGEDDEEEDIKRFAGGNGEADDDDDDEEEEGEEDDEEGEEEEGEDA